MLLSALPENFRQQNHEQIVLRANSNSIDYKP